MANRHPWTRLGAVAGAAALAALAIAWLTREDSSRRGSPPTDAESPAASRPPVPEATSSSSAPAPTTLQNPAREDARPPAASALRGVVLNVDGTPAANVNIFLDSLTTWSAADRRWERSPTKQRWTRSKERGEFAFQNVPRGRLMLRAALAGPHEEERDREVRLELEHPHAGPIELRLEPVQWIVGRVDRSDGSPAQGAHVNLYSKAPTRNGTVYVPRFHAGSEAAVCDSAGDFRVKKPWDPDIVLQAFIPPQPGGPRLQVSTPLRVMDSRQPQVLSLRPTTGVVRLRVIDAEFGSPVFGCKLRIVGGPVFDGYLVGDSRDPASWTQELGYGNYAIPYEPTGGAPFRVKIESKKFCAIETAELTGDGREDLGPIEVQLKRLSSIHGKLVQSADGAPARSVRVHILTDPNGLATRHASQPSSSQRFAMSVNSAFTVSSEDGSFSFEGIPPGRFKLWVIDAAHCLDGDAFIEVPEAGTRYDIELKTVKPARIKGTVRTDGPVKDKVTVALEYPDKTPITRQLDADLGFDFTRLRPGTFKLTARATLESGDAVSGSASVTVQAGDSASVEIVLGSDK